MKHNYIKLMLSVLLCIATLSVSAHDFEVGGIYYNITSSEDLTVAVTFRGSSASSYSNEYSGYVFIPETVVYDENTYRVTSIGNNAFLNCSGLIYVTIPNSVTSIGNYAFYECSGLTSVTIPNSVTSIGGYAFRGCSGLTSVTIPNSVTNIGNWAFSGTAIASLVYTSTLFVYLPKAYSGSYTIPDGIKEICGGAFSGCSGLTSVTIPNSVTSIGSSAFSGCSGLTSITIPNSVTSIGSSAFYGTAIASPVYTSTQFAYLPKAYSGSYTIPDGIKEICGAFSGCSGLTSVTIPNSVTSIGSSAFENCSGLTSVTIPNSVTSIGSSAFYNCI